MDKSIKYEGLEVKKEKYGNKYVIKSGKDNYFFYDTVKGGGKSKAVSQWEQFNFKLGEVLEIAVDEQPDSFVNDKGKTVNYTKRKIMYFLTTEEGAPKGLPPGVAPEKKSVEERLSDVERQVEELVDKVLNSLDQEQPF